MAERINEEQFKVGQASQVATEGSAFSRADKLASKLESLVSNLGTFGVGMSKQFLASQEEKTNEELAEEFAANPDTFFTQFERRDDKGELIESDVPNGWTKLKWDAYNKLKATSDAQRIRADFETSKANYITDIQNDTTGTKKFNQQDLDVIYQNKLDSYIRSSNGNSTYLQTFFPSASQYLNTKLASDRKDVADQTLTDFTNKQTNTFATLTDPKAWETEKEERWKKNPLSVNGTVSFDKAPEPTLEEDARERAQWIGGQYSEMRSLLKNLGVDLSKDDTMKNFFGVLEERAEGGDLSSVYLMKELLNYKDNGVALGVSSQAEALINSTNVGLSYFKSDDDVVNQQRAFSFISKYSGGEPTIVTNEETGKDVITYTSGVRGQFDGYLNNIVKGVSNMPESKGDYDYDIELSFVRKSAEAVVDELKVELQRANAIGDTNLQKIVQDEIDYFEDIATYNFTAVSDADTLAEIHEDAVEGTLTRQDLVRNLAAGFLSYEDYKKYNPNGTYFNQVNKSRDEIINRFADYFNIPRSPDMVTLLLQDITGDPFENALGDVIAYLRSPRMSTDQFFQILNSNSVIEGLKEYIPDLKTRLIALEDAQQASLSSSALSEYMGIVGKGIEPLYNTSDYTGGFGDEGSTNVLVPGNNSFFSELFFGDAYTNTNNNIEILDKDLIGYYLANQDNYDSYFNSLSNKTSEQENVMEALRKAIKAEQQKAASVGSVTEGIKSE